MLRLVSFFTLLVITSSLELQNFVQAQSQQNTKLIPFFDNLNNPVPVGFPPGQQLDISPPPPQLNAFDNEVLKACGSIGSNVSPNRFKNLLSANPQVLDKIQQATGGELRAGRRRRSDFLSTLR